jgi:hypothetical protein
MSGIGEQVLDEKMHRLWKRTPIAVSVFAFDTEMCGKGTT